MGVDLLLHALEGRLVEGGLVGEVKAQALRRHEGPLLAHVRAQNLSQRSVHQVGRRVIALDVATPRLVHLRQRGSGLKRFAEGANHGAPAVDLLHILDGQLPPVALHHPRVAHLAARLGVKRILLQHDLQLITRLAKRDGLRLGARRVVPDPLLLALGLHLDPFAALRGTRCRHPGFARCA